MKELNTQTIIDYTAVPAGWLIKGHLWTGQSTVSTITCPKCGRVGVICSQRKGQQIIVHSGRVENERLTGIDYCEIAINPNIRIKRTEMRTAHTPAVSYEHAPYASLCHRSKTAST